MFIDTAGFVLLQIKEEVDKLLQLKSQLGDGDAKGKFVLKCPKVNTVKS